MEILRLTVEDLGPAPAALIPSTGFLVSGMQKYEDAFEMIAVGLAVNSADILIIAARSLEEAADLVGKGANELPRSCSP